VGVVAEDERSDVLLGEVDGSTTVVDDADECVTLDKVLDALVVDETEGLLE
jgi:hypothetical protein